MNLGEHQQNVLRKIQVTLCKCKKDNVGRGLWGCQPDLGKPRTKAKGCRAQTEGEEEKFSLSEEERKENK